MSAITITRAPISDTDANFRLWGKVMSDQFAAGGLVQTSDTGQINWTTASKPTVANQVVGYEMWRSNDASGGLNNWYMKTQYGSGGSVAAGPRFIVQFGWGSDGAGNLTGFTTTAQNNIGTFAGSATLFNCNLAVGTGWISIAMFITQAQSAFFFGVERTRDSMGAETDEILALFSTSNMVSQVCNRLTGTYPAETSPIAQLLINNVNAVQGSIAGYSIQFGQKGGAINPSINAFGTVAGTIGSVQSTTTIKAYGVTRTYIINGTLPNFSSSPAQIILSRFE